MLLRVFIEATNFVTIKSLPNTNSTLHIEIIDASGKVVFQQKTNFKKEKSEQQIDISDLANGIYMLKIKSDSGNSQTLKLVKE